MDFEGEDTLLERHFRDIRVSTAVEEWFLRAFRERDVGGRGPVDEKRATSGLRVPATARPAPIHDKCGRTVRIPIVAV